MTQPKMVDQPTKTLQDLVDHLGQYPEGAFLFVRNGLSYAADKIHGPESEAHRQLQQILLRHDLDWADLIERYNARELPEPIIQAIDEAGGSEKLNRHVSGRELCWALRDFAVERWGPLARVVLRSWNVERTLDFGRIVFGFIDFDMMRKQPGDSIGDFEDVYDFGDAFGHPTDDTNDAG